MSSETVRALSYRVVWEDNVDYEKAPAIHADTDAFSLSLSGRELRAELRQPLHDIAEARRLVDEYLEAWRVLIGLQQAPGNVRFVFERAEVEEKDQANPTIGKGGKVLQAKCSVTVSVDRHISHVSYPEPPENFIVSPDVRVMFVRYEDYRKDREPLLSMANFCLTVLEQSAGGRRKRKQAARKYSIEEKVLNRLGRMCARGSEREARKAPANLAFAPLRSDDREWVVAVVKAMIRRAGEVAANPKGSHPLLTLAALV
jgi:hypothetical protein